ncbi:MAG: RagB/SusD family nutrient uptake outer membrane protein [Bacteroidales bacterium]|nr:RagB/SusD family nutrient uptake outer membrane protein [Bacteroidales bacterium]
MKRNMKYLPLAALATLILATPACSDYLDVVPDKTQEVSLLYERKESAQRALATCYHYIHPKCYINEWTCASNEVAANYSQVGASANHVTEAFGLNAVMGKLNADNVVLSYWENNGSYGYLPNNYQAIRVCNEFLDNIDMVPDMTVAEKEKWKGEVLTLKAYYHFLLFKEYGPIILMKESLPIGASEDEVQQHRSPVSEVVDYLVEILDQAIPMLPERISSINDYGHINRPIAQAIKGQVLLFAASPLFNNNPLYAGFVDNEGRQLFPQDNDETAMWRQAAEALKEAIEGAEKADARLYHFSGAVPDYETTADGHDYYAEHLELMKPMYDYRYMIMDNTNMEETVWGTYNIDYSDDGGTYSWMYPFNCTQVKVDRDNNSNCWQWLAANMAFTEEYYTVNGLPITEDPEFDYAGRYDLIDVPEEYYYLAAENEQTARMHFGREPRFYATFGFDRARVRSHAQLLTLKMRSGEVNGRSTADPDWNISGYAILKLIHPSWNHQQAQITKAPWPIIRLGELYLDYAEALNEVEGPSAEVIHYLDAIRERAGIPGVMEAWAKSRTPGKPSTKEGMREIIQQERNIELAYEGFRNEDSRRWLKAVDWFNGEVTGWNYEATDAEGYYHKRQNPQIRQSFGVRNYLWPIVTDEIVKNKNLVQNPGY